MTSSSGRLKVGYAVAKDNNEIVKIETTRYSKKSISKSRGAASRCSLDRISEERR